MPKYVIVHWNTKRLRNDIKLAWHGDNFVSQKTHATDGEPRVKKEPLVRVVSMTTYARIVRLSNQLQFVGCTCTQYCGSFTKRDVIIYLA